MPRVCLIIPPSAFLLDERVFPSLGILKVAASLEAGGARVDMLDLSGIENYTDPLKELGTYDAIGITTTTPQLPATMKILATLREMTDTKIILGGPHVTLSYSARKMERKMGRVGRGHAAVARLEEAFDVLISGDGEIAIWEAIKKNAPKAIDADDNKGSLFLTDQTYEASAFPARHLIDMGSYHYSIEGKNACSLVSQLGCPFGCGFCGGRNSKSLRVIRSRSTASVMREIKLLHETYGYDGFMFYDDELNVSKSLVPLMNELADYQERIGAEFRLRGFVKAELFNAEQAKAMYRAGFRWLLCGFEAADPRILVNIEKRADLDDNTRCLQTAKQHGLKVKALMSAGHPGESEKTIQAIRNWLIANQADDFDCTVITPYPGTNYHDLAVPHGEIPGVWTYTHPKTGDRLHAREMDYMTTADYYKGVPGEYESHVFTDYLSAKELVGMRDWVEEDVRKALSIPFNQSQTALRYEHSMGQGLPGFVFRSADAGLKQHA